MPLLSTLARDFCAAVSFVICKNTKVCINKIHLESYKLNEGQLESGEWELKQKWKQDHGNIHILSIFFEVKILCVH